MSGSVSPDNANAPAREKLDPIVWRVAAVAFLGPFIAQMDSTVVNFSLSRIREDLQATLVSAQWIVSGYLLALALMLPLNGWLVDRLGIKKLFITCFIAFTGTSLLCGMATTMNGLIAARVIQGIAGGLMAPMAQLMLARAAGRHFSRVVGYTAIPVLLAPLIGPVLAGAILKYAAWPWLFYINLPVGILAVTMAVFVLPPDETAPQKRPFDFLGFILVSPGMVGLLYGFEHIADREGQLLLALSAAMLVAFAFDASRKKSAALIDLSLFTNRIFRKAVSVLFLANGLLYAGQMLIPLYLIAGCGFSVTKSSLLLAPIGVGMMCMSPLLGYLTERFGCRKLVVAGVIINIMGSVPFLWMIYDHFSSPLMVICMLMRGVGQGATGLPAMAAAYASIPKDQLSLATTANNVIQRLGGPIMTTALAFIMAAVSEGVAPTKVGEFTVPFLAFIALQLCVFFAALGLPIWLYKSDPPLVERKV